MSPSSEDARLESAALEALVFECLERSESEGDGALEALCAAHPAEALALRERMAVLRRAGLVGSAAPAAFPESLGDFRLIETLGGGGMGVVYLAEQKSLGRRVALKLIRPEHLYFPGSRERFKREVEAVARLQHPSIAPVYTVGDERGLPYFAMEYVLGVALADALTAFQGRDPNSLTGRDLETLIRARVGADPGSGADRTSLFEGPWTTVVLRILHEIAAAVAHAHERGVLHRDIKPSNVMITARGRVALLDFGLASLSGTSKLTRTGSQLGSLPYMAPEQVNGEVDAIDERTDVYAMGVTLYELLALSAPYFDPQSSERTRQLVLEGEAPPLRSVVAGVSRDVETVCATAMEVVPERRYPTARAFGRDIENVLARRTIAARRAGWMLKTWRWTQRHPARAAALLLAVGAPLGLAIQQVAANRTVSGLNLDLREALTQSRHESIEKETQRDIAERNFEDALAAVETMLQRVGSDRLRYVPQMESVREELLRDALRFYADLGERGAENRRLRVAEVETRTMLGDLLIRLGRADEAEAELNAVIATLELEPNLSEWGRYQYAAVRAKLAETRRMGSEPQVAVEIVREVVTRLQDLLQNGTSTSQELYQRDLAEALTRQGELEFALGEIRQAEASHEGALATLRPLLAAPKPSRQIYFTAARSLGRLASMRSERREFDAAIAAAVESVAILEKLHAADPDDSDCTLQLMSDAGNLGDLYGEVGRLEESAPLVERALNLGEKLVADYPNTTRFRQNLSIVYVQAFFVEFSSGRMARARERLEQALALQSRLVRDDPTNSEYLGAMCSTYGNLGALLVEIGEVEAAIAQFAASEDAILRALESNTKSPEWIRWHQSCVRNRAIVLGDVGRIREAKEVVEHLARHEDETSAVLAGMLFARTAGAAEKLGNSSEAEIRDLDTRALAALRLALERGLADPRFLEESHDWERLRERKEFQECIAEVRERAAARRRR
ncbi:MAG: protein kinase [Planctomycetes bacterium]|nr:protein kinase [Planctomycetota bacterium]